MSLVLLLGLGGQLAIASEVESNSETTPRTTPATFGDEELTAALASSALIEEWLEASPVSDQASLVEVTDSVQYTSARAEFLQLLQALGERHAHVAARTQRLDLLAKHVDLLDSLVHRIRRAIVVTDRSSTFELTKADAAHARSILAQIDVRAHWLGFSLDPVSMAEHRLAAAHGDLLAEIEQLVIEDQAARDRSAVKTHGLTIARLGRMQESLVDIRRLIDLGEEHGAHARLELELGQAEAIAQMPELHSLRMLAATSVDGLPLVTVDAYIQGAATLDESCPVDWTLLAGVGRIESRHGTTNDGSVQASGRVTQPILGPLLDGGATAREAVAAAEAAEEEALLAEQAAAEAERIAAEEEFEASVWGQLRREEEVGGAVLSTEGGPGAVVAAPAPSEDADGNDERAAEDPPPQHDPQLWGEPPPRDDEDATASGDDDQDADDDEAEEDEEEEREFKGNGFAVIHDSDNGRLDGNARWDRAVGPMQFIPETWSYWETDGNGDGVLDPQNLYDAAASAGRFLCYLSRTRGTSPWTFILGYNSSETYVRNVLSSAEALRGAELPDIAAISS